MARVQFFSQQTTNCNYVLATHIKGDKPKSDSRPKSRSKEDLTLRNKMRKHYI